jgi:hypothetical protein
MSSELEPSGRGYFRVVSILAAILGIGVAGFLLAGGRSSTKEPKQVSRAVVEEDGLRDAREVLARDADIASCKDAISKINTHLGRHPELRPPAVGADTLAKLGERFGFDAGDLAEAGNAGYTPLDARHLDECLLLRDAARSLDAEESNDAGKTLRRGPVERAAAAFRWVVRQVRPVQYGSEPLPPAFTLRRGCGSAWERGLVFLALLDQDPGPERLRGCLLTVPDRDGKRSSLWACGVVVGDDPKVYLFDPHLGLPLPDAKGTGVATLDAAATDAAVLARLDAGPGERYDVAPEQARAAEGLTVLYLSALAPRMRYLEENLLKGNLRVRLSADPADVDRMNEAIKSSGGKGATPWKRGTGLTRRFLSKDDGGVDVASAYPLSMLPGFARPGDRTQVQLTRMQLYEWSLVPWEALPPQFNPEDFPVTLDLGQRVRELFASPFTQPVRDAHGSRELLVRGQYARAIPRLVTEDSDLREQISRRKQAKNLDREVADWLRVAREAYANLLRARNARSPAAETDASRRVAALWTPELGQPVYLLLHGALAGPRDAEVTYQLCLCKHEQAEQLQARLDLQTRNGVSLPASDVERCRQAWADAKGWWDHFAADYGRGPAATAARQNLGRAEAMLGDWQAAASTWGDAGGSMTPPERLAALYRAREARMQLPPKP